MFVGVWIVEKLNIDTKVELSFMNDNTYRFDLLDETEPLSQTSIYSIINEDSIFIKHLNMDTIIHKFEFDDNNEQLIIKDFFAPSIGTVWEDIFLSKK